jgi:hypothetical protein
MSVQITKLFVLLTIVVAFVSISKVASSDSVEWTVFQTLQLEEDAIDVAVSADGKLLFVLTEQGKIIIFSSPTKVEAKIDVGEHANQIKLGPRGDTLVVNSRGNKKVQFILLEFIQNIDVSGSPFKGAKDSPVVVAVFNDFE